MIMKILYLFNFIKYVRHFVIVLQFSLKKLAKKQSPIIQIMLIIQIYNREIAKTLNVFIWNLGHPYVNV